MGRSSKMFGRLARNIRRCWRSVRRRSGVVYLTEGAAPDPPAVLVVEPNGHMLSAVCVALEAEGYAVIVSRTGRTARHVLAEAKIKFVIMNWALPKNRALRLLQRLRAHQGSKPIPVCLIVRRAEAVAQRLQELHLSVEVLLARPFGTDEVRRVAHLLQTDMRTPVTVCRQRRISILTLSDLRRVS